MTDHHGKTTTSSAVNVRPPSETKRRHGTDYCAFAHTSVNRDNVILYYCTLHYSYSTTTVHCTVASVVRTVLLCTTTGSRGAILTTRRDSGLGTRCDRHIAADPTPVSLDMSMVVPIEPLGVMTWLARETENTHDS